MKKLLSLGLAAMLAFGLATTSFAATDDAAAEPTATPTYTDMSQAVIKKVYAATNSGTTSPAEIFHFTIERTSVSDAAAGIDEKNMPLPTIGVVEYAEGDAGVENKMTKELVVNLNKPGTEESIYSSVGVYTYTIRETVNTPATAGVTYYSDPITLKVTVIEQNGQIRVAAVHTEKEIVDTDKNKENTTKSDTITNVYSAGSLAVKKEVKGNLGDTNKEFNVKVTFNKPTGKSVNGTISYIEDGVKKTITPKDWKDGDNEKDAVEVSIALKDQETITFTNIPYEVTYTVEEDNYTSEKYKTTYTYTDSNEEGKHTGDTVDSAQERVTITNTKNGEIDNGVVLNNMPYVLVLAVLAAGVAVFIIRKRRED